jgi:DNA invertase Pin-like site-specific DNA recombinase
MSLVQGSAVQNVVIYARAGNETALERQVLMLEAHAKEQGWMVTEVYTDIGKGSFRNRKGLSKMVADARSGKLNVILTADLSRLFRGKEFLPAIFEDLMSGEVRLVTLDGCHTLERDAEVDCILLQIGVEFHRMYLANHSRRIAIAREHRKASQT